MLRHNRPRWACFGVGVVAIKTSITTAMEVQKGVVGSGDWTFNQDEWLPLVITVAILICAIAMVVACVPFCDRYFMNVFQKFENPAEMPLGRIETPPATTTATTTAQQFAMYPPTHNTLEFQPSPPVYFEPLSSVPLPQPPSSPVVDNHLHPKVARLSMRDSLLVEDADGRFIRDLSSRTSQQNRELQDLILSNSGHIPRGQLQYIKELGSGWFGKVLRGEGDNILPGHKRTKVVVRMLRETSSTEEQLSFLQEASPYQLVDHPNVLHVLGACVETAPFLVVMELCPFGDLKSYLKSHRVALQSFDEKGLLLKFACDMAAGLSALHQLNFVHRDFAIRNCLLTSDLSVKIGDYGFSEEAFKEDYYIDSSGNAIAIRWMAPETILYSIDDETVSVQSITKAANIWSFGIVLWEVVQFGMLPYNDLSDKNVLRLVITERSVKLSRPDINISSIDRLYELMCLCWCDRPSLRPSLRELRIMLLHLMSHRLDVSAAASAAFDRKWNQLLPQHRPPLVDGQPPIGDGRPSLVEDRPSVTFGRPTTIEMSGSMLCQAGSLQSVDDDARGGAVASPVNELSLEAEMSALHSSKNRSSEMNGRPNGEVVATKQPAVRDDSMARVSYTECRSAQHEGTVEPPRSDLISRHKQALGGVPFMTSTPKHSSDTISETTTTTDDDSQNGLRTALSEQESSTQLYETALSSQSLSRSLSQEDRSFLQPAKFAALLQTVAMSIDDDDDDDGHSLTEADDRSLADIDDVFADINMSSHQTLTPSYATLQATGMSSGHGEDSSAVRCSDGKEENGDSKQNSQEDVGTNIEEGGGGRGGCNSKENEEENAEGDDCSGKNASGASGSSTGECAAEKFNSSLEGDNGNGLVNECNRDMKEDAVDGNPKDRDGNVMENNDHSGSACNGDS